MAAKELILGLKTAFIWCTFSIQRVNYYFQCFLQAFSLEITLFYATPSEQIISCHVAHLKMLRFFGLLHPEEISY